MSGQRNSIKKKTILSRLHMIIIILLMFGFGFLPPVGTITVVGMRALGVFIGLLYGWSTCGMLWPSLLGIFALGFSGLGSVKDMLVMGFSNEIVIFLIFILVLVEMLRSSGATDVVVRFFITRKSLQGHPWLFSFVFLLGGGILATFGQPFAIVLMLWGILETLFVQRGYKPYDTFPTIMILGAAIGCAAVGLMVPFKGLPLMLLGTYTGLTHLPVNYLRYMLVMIPTGLLFLVGYLFFSRIILKPDMTPMKNINVNELLQGDAKATKRQKVTLLAFGFFLLLLLIPGALPSTWPFVIWMNQIGIAGIAVFCTVLFTLIHIDGEPLLDFSKLSPKGMNWPIVFMVAVLLMMAPLLMNDATGIKTSLLMIMRPILTHCSGTVLLLLLLLIATIMTNFMNNMVVGFMLIPVVIAISSAVQLNAMTGTLMILVACNAAFLTPAASPLTAMVFARKEWVRGRDIVKLGAIAVVLLMLLGATVTAILTSLIF